MGKFSGRSSFFNGDIASGELIGRLGGGGSTVSGAGAAIVSTASLYATEETAVIDWNAVRGTTHAIERGSALQVRHLVTDPRALLLTAPGCGVDEVGAKTFDGYARHADGVAGGTHAATNAPIDDEPTQIVTVGGTVSGTIDATGDEDLIQVSLVAGQTYSFYLYGSGPDGITDSFLQLFAPNGTTLINEDDDGGVGLYSMITFTATSTGVYTLVAASFDNEGDPGTGDWTLAVHQQGADEAPGTLPSTVDAVIGLNYGFISPAGTDIDIYKIDLTAGMLYNFEVAAGADYNTDFLAVGSGEVDTYIRIYNSAGTLVYSNDDIDFPSDISSAVGFLPDADGTYYVRINGYANQAGGYVLDITETDPATLDPLDAIDWGGPANRVDNGHTLLIYFATEGETYDGVEDLGGWTPYLQAQALAAFQTYSQFADLTFAITTDQSQADFTLVTTESDEYLAYFNPPGTPNAGVGVFAINGTGWDSDGSLGSMEPGGYGWITFIHEFGHGLGMAHPHDNGGGSDVMPGVTGPFGSYGIYDLNQGVYTTMSYNDGWQLHPSTDANGFPVPDTLDYGYQGAPMAFDIALMQIKYGSVSANTGDNVYDLGLENVAGTYYQTIWDTGGTDEIRYTGLVNATIDLTAATLDYSPTGAGVLSWAEGIFGGFTIANSVVIENATGGSGDDVLVGNAVGNILIGNDGNDTFVGKGGDDQIIGGGGLNTAVYVGNMADYTITAIPGGYTVTDNNGVDGDEGSDTLTDITYLKFADGTINLADEPGNQTPTLDDLGPTAVFNENLVNSTPQLIDANVTFRDSDDNFDGGLIQVSGLLAEDRVDIRNEGNGPGQIHTDEGDIYYGGVLVGSYSGGVGGTLAVLLNAAATALAVEAIIENLTYANISNSPTQERTLTINVFDDESASTGGGSVFIPGPFVELTGGADPLAGLPTFGPSPALAFIDVDNDGNLDIVVGDQDASLRYFHNDGAGYTEVTGASNPFLNVTVPSGSGTSYYSSPFTIDIDGDGDMDIVVSNNYGYFSTVQNNGNGTWTQLVGAANPLDGIQDPYFADATAIDYDGDGDVDIVSGSRYGDVYAIRNNGGGNWEMLTGGGRPFAGIDVGTFSSITSGDVDGDGDADLVIGEADGTLNVYLNQGGGTFLAAGPAGNPWNGIDFGSFSIPVFGDIDGDGDLDLIVADDAGGDTRVWENTSTTTAASGPTITITVNQQNDAPSGSNVLASIVENSVYTFGANDFGFSDTDGHDLMAVVITTLPFRGDLLLDGNPITSGTAVDIEDIIAGLLTFTPDPDENGANYTAFTFQVRDTGGVDNGGTNTDPTPNTFSFQVTPDNFAPTLTGVDTPVTFLENTVNATPQLLDADVVFSDSEDNFDGGSLTVTGLLAEDRVGVRNVGTGSGQISVAGGVISFEGTPIGTYTGGVGNTLTVTFNADADTQSIEALIQNLTYANVSDTPTASRTLVIDVFDDEGLHLGTNAAFDERTGVDNPFADVVALGNGSIPTFVDVDGDGDLDLVVGAQYGYLQVFDNDGAGHFTELLGNANPFAGFYGYGTYTAPAAIDVDGDGDLDLVVGSNYGDLLVLENDGAGGWSFAGSLAGVAVYAFSTPTAVDLDGDGLDDLVVGSITGFLYGFLNNGDGTFTELTGANDPFLQVAVPYFAAPSFIDIDGDGDMDAVVGDYYGGVTVFTNEGGIFSYAAEQPFAGEVFGSIPAFTFYDVDGDGDLDAVVGSVYGDIRLFENNSATAGAITVNVTAEADSGTAPTGTDGAVGVPRSSYHVMQLSEFGFGDVDGDTFASVTITTLPTAGRLFLNGVKVVAGQVITAADISGGNLVYQSTSAKGTMTFQVHDSSASNNVDLTPNTLSFRIANTAPTGTNGTVGVSATVNHVVTASEFGFGDVDGNSFASVTITTLPAAGRLLLDGVKVVAGQVVSAADIAAGKLVYRPAAGASGGQSTSWTFQVHDNGGTLLGGIDTDQSPNTLTYTVQNRAPDGADNVVGFIAATNHAITVADLGFSDVDGNAFASVTVTTLATGGKLLLSGVPVTVGQVISAADVTAGNFVFSPRTATSASFTFQVHDNGGTAYGGVDVDGTPNTMTLTLAAPPAAETGGAQDDAAKVVFTVGEDSLGLGIDGSGVTDFGGGAALARPTLHLAEAQSAVTHFDAVLADLLGGGNDLGSLADAMVWDNDLSGVSTTDFRIDALDPSHFALVADRGWASDFVL